MVVGNGLIARAFSLFKEREDVIIFASGVSNSSETSSEAYAREENLLRNHLRKNTLLVYFSTFSVFDPSLANSAYVKHKLAMEKLIQTESNSHIIFRLPIMVGGSKNPNTLVNFLVNNIQQNQRFTLYSKACRYLLSVEDLTNILPSIINDSKFANSVFNVSNTGQLKVTEIVSGLERVLNKKALFESVEKGDCYTVEISEEIKSHPGFKVSGLDELLAKYYTVKA